MTCEIMEDIIEDSQRIVNLSEKEKDDLFNIEKLKNLIQSIRDEIK